MCLSIRSSEGIILSTSQHLLSPIEIGNGLLALGHRLKVKVLADIKAQGVTHVVTLLSEKEGALDVKKAVEKNNLGWLWLPLENAKPPETYRLEEIRRMFSQWQALLEQGSYLYIHCAAGIHRTGMITYAFFRYLSLSSSESFQRLYTLRQILMEEVGYERFHWGNYFSPNYNDNLPIGEISVNEMLTQDLIGCVCYAFSVGEGYQYRGKLKRFFADGSIELVDVETTSNEECDFKFTNPYSIAGSWIKYEDIEYSSNSISVTGDKKGLEINYAYAGTVYIHYKN